MVVRQFQLLEGPKEGSGQCAENQSCWKQGWLLALLQEQSSGLTFPCMQRHEPALCNPGNCTFSLNSWNLVRLEMIKSF